MMGAEKPVRVGIVGMGGAGSLHARELAENRIPGAILTAVVCQAERLRDVSPFLPPSLTRFDTLSDLLAVRPADGESVCDALIIATPHRDHPAQTVAALQAGLHVFCEKPAGIRAREARDMASVAEKCGRVYALNFNRRTVPLYQTLRTLVQQGEMGTLRRVLWTSTDWLRVQAYYDSSAWRGTWAGEGGGLLLNQWPHLLDLWQWIFGLPVRLRASCGWGKYHRIEVEDDVCVWAEYSGGATAVLIGTTGEVPGTERIEIVGSRGRIIVENETLHLTRLQSAETVDDFIRDAPAGFSRPATRDETFTISGDGDLTAGITKDFIHAIIAGSGDALIAPGSDGAASLMLANAILLSAWHDGAWVETPLGEADETRFEQLLDEKIKASPPPVRRAVPSAALSLEESWKKQ